MKHFFFRNQRGRSGFTVIEMVVVMGIISILFALSLPQLFRLQNRSSLQAANVKLISFIRQQQLSAMNSDQMYGVYFEPTQYTLFSGSTYSPSSQDNTIIPLDYPVEFSQILFPASGVTFASGSGDIVDFDPVNHSIALTDTVNNQEINIEFNALGVPIDIQ